MLLDVIKQRVDDYNSMKKFYVKDDNKESCTSEMDTAVRVAVTTIAMLMILYIVLFFLSIFYAFRCAKLFGWNPATPYLLLALTFLPIYGGLFTIGIVIYGMVNCGCK